MEKVEPESVTILKNSHRCGFIALKVQLPEISTVPPLPDELMQPKSLVSIRDEIFKIPPEMSMLLLPVHIMLSTLRLPPEMTIEALLFIATDFANAAAVISG